MSLSDRASTASNGLQYSRILCNLTIFGYPRSQIDDDFEWVKGTVWNWNDWRHVTLKPDGSFIAPTPECSQPNGATHAPLICWSSGPRDSPARVL